MRSGVSIGMYSSEGEWPMTVGAGCTAFTNLPLWYAVRSSVFLFFFPFYACPVFNGSVFVQHYDGNPDFSDGLYQFGGWTSPAMKQFDDSASNSCGLSVDRNWYPSSLWEKRPNARTLPPLPQKMAAAGSD